MGTTASATLSDEQIAAYHRDGYLVLEDALTADQVTALRADFEEWKEESRGHTTAYGVTLDGRGRFDIEPGHSAANPALRRVASPIEVSDAYLAAMREAPGVDAVAQLIGPNVEFNNCKVNSKQPGAATHVKYHQDFNFQPHSNQDLLAVLYFLDEVTPDNGPLTVVPGSHAGPLYEHWHDGVFTGAVDAATATWAETAAVSCVGPPGTACFMHTRLLHGSGPNVTDAPRTLFIAEYRSEDAVPLATNHLPSIYEGELVRGERTGRVRCTAYEMQIPEVPTGASFFSQQAKADSLQM